VSRWVIGVWGAACGGGAPARPSPGPPYACKSARTRKCTATLRASAPRL
jgi:hypothetical protein